MRAELRLWYDEEILDAGARSSDSAAFEVTYGMPLDPDPHPLVVWLFYDHPPIRRRLALADG